MKKFISALAVVLALSVSSLNYGTAQAQDFQKGAAAYDAGDYATALQEWRPLAEQGDADAQFGLGVMYGNGEGVPQDYTEAVNWHRRAAEQGQAFSQYSLGWIYQRGEGVPQDNILAHMWYNIGIANGNTLSSSIRDIIAESMTPQDISTAQAMARDCMSSNYQNCGY
jgi:TPR repeat protein